MPSGASHPIVGRTLCAAAALAFLAATTAAEPRIELRLGAFPGLAFPNFSSVILPSEPGRLELWIQDALGEIQVSTVRVRLNELPMTPFVAVNPLPRGVRLLLKEGLTLNPEYRLRQTGENVVAVFAQDDTKTAYQGQFYVTIDPTATTPRAAPMRARAPAREVAAPEQKLPPRVVFTSEWPARTTEALLTLLAEATDVEGISRLVVEVNGSDVDEIVMQNGIPVRKHRGWMTSGKAPGAISGDSFKLAVDVPVKLGKDVNVVAVRVENALGLRTRLDRTVVRVQPGR